MKYKIIKFILTLLQVLLIIPPVVLQYLSDKKMGVMRYLVFNKSMFSIGFFSPDRMLLYKIILIALIVIGIFAIIYFLRKKINIAMVVVILKVVILNFIAIIFFFSVKLQGLLAYHYMLIVVVIILILQYIKVIFDFRRSK